MISFDFREIQYVSLKDVTELRELCKEKGKINLGCGTDIRENCLNVDIQPFKGVDLIADVSDLRFLEEKSVDYIVAQHILEYIPRNFIVKTLIGWRLLMDEESHLELRVTDIAALTKSLYLNQVSGEMGFSHEMVMALIYGKQKDSYDMRYSGFTSEFLQGILTSCGFFTANVAHEDNDIILTAKRDR